MSIEQEKKKEIERAIMEVIVFFDIFDFTLTAFEIWKYLPIKCELADVQAIMLDESLNEKIENKNGFYFLRGREEIIVTRMKRYNYANEKFKVALFMARFFKFIPWVKMIAIGNMIGANNLKKDSDIDLFIVSQKNRIWLTRLFCVGVAILFRMRPTKSNVKNKICLSFFVSEDALDLQKLTLDNDKYFLYWLAELTPIYGLDVYKNFVTANSWIKNELPNWEEFNPVSRFIEKRISNIYTDIFDIIIGWSERYAKSFQLKHFPPEIKNLMNKDTRVVISDQILKFHVNDRRREYNMNYELRITNYV